MHCDKCSNRDVIKGLQNRGERPLPVIRRVGCVIGEKDKSAIGGEEEFARRRGKALWVKGMA